MRSPGRPHFFSQSPLTNSPRQLPKLSKNSHLIETNRALLLAREMVENFHHMILEITASIEVDFINILFEKIKGLIASSSESRQSLLEEYLQMQKLHQLTIRWLNFIAINLIELRAKLIAFTQLPQEISYLSSLIKSLNEWKQKLNSWIYQQLLIVEQVCKFSIVYNHHPSINNRRIEVSQPLVASASTPSVAIPLLRVNLFNLQLQDQSTQLPLVPSFLPSGFPSTLSNNDQNNGSSWPATIRGSTIDANSLNQPSSLFASRTDNYPTTVTHDMPPLNFSLGRIIIPVPPLFANNLGSKASSNSRNTPS